MNVKLILTVVLSGLLMIVVAACGGSDNSSAFDQNSGEILIQPVGNQMEFQQKSFTVEAGQEVTITFENLADSPAMQHNVVVLSSNSQDDVNRVGQAAVAAGEENAYIPEDDAILAYTDLAPPGETVSVTFTAPSEPGEYLYICTFPGHYMAMQGTMTVV